MDIISEQSSETEYNQSIKPSNATKFNVVSRKSKDGTFVSVKDDIHNYGDYMNNYFENEEKQKIKQKNNYYDDDEDDSLDEQLHYFQRDRIYQKKQNEKKTNEKKNQNYQHNYDKINQNEIINQNKNNQSSNKENLNEQLSEKRQEKKSLYQRIISQDEKLVISSDSDSYDEIKKSKSVSKQNSNNKQTYGSNKKIQLFEKNFIHDENDNFQIIKNQMSQEQNQLPHHQFAKSGTTFDKSISDIDLEESGQDPKKDTFNKIREDLLRQLDSEREKNRMMEQKLLSRDKSFMEIKTQFNELLFKYEGKNKECAMLRKNNNQNISLQNQSHNLSVCSKTSKKTNSVIDYQEEQNSVDKRYNEIIQKYKVDSDDDNFVNQNDYSRKKERESISSNQNSNSKNKIYDYKNNQINDSQRDSYKRKRNDNISSDLTAPNKFNEIEVLQKNQEKYLLEIQRLKLELDESQFQISKQNQQNKDLEKEIKRLAYSSEQEDRKESQFQSITKNNEKLKEQLEQSNENLKKTKLEVNNLKKLIQEKDEKLKRLERDENENQDLLTKAEKLLKQYEDIKEEYREQSIECERLMKENKELKLKQQDNKELQLRNFIEQQDNLIQRLSQELKTQKNSFLIQIDQASVSIMSLVQKILGSRGDSLTQTSQLSLWINEALGKEVNKEKYESENSFEQNSERNTLNQQQIHFLDILKEVEQISKDYERYKDFAKAFKDMIKSIAKNELNQSPTLKDCWKYFKWLYQHYIKGKLDDQMNQSTTHILMKMLKVQNEHEIIISVQNLINQNERLKHIQQMQSQKAINQQYQNIQPQKNNIYPEAQQAKQSQNNNTNSNYQQNSNMQRVEKENQPYNNQKDFKNQKSLDNTKRSKSLLNNKVNNSNQSNISGINQTKNTTSQTTLKNQNLSFSPNQIVHTQLSTDDQTNNNWMNQESISSYRIPNLNTQTSSTHINSHFDSQYYSSNTYKNQNGEQQQQNTRNVQSMKQTNQRQNSRSMSRQQINNID